MDKLNLFVSSTCYDLSQIRNDLHDFITTCGHTPILSEFYSFPIDPNKTTIENCIDVINKNADLLILIIGNRYGSVIENGKSITNQEYITAKNKGIPVFIFIDKRSLNAFDFWKENTDGNFERFVDNKKIFEFIDDVRSNSLNWTFGFENAQDIIETLKIQMSYLFKNALSIKSRIDRETSELDHLVISTKALKIVADKAAFWEYLFFAEIFIDEIKKKEQKKNDLKYKIFYEPKFFLVNISDVLRWSQDRLEITLALTNSITNLINSALKDYINEPGQPSDLRGLYYVAHSYARLFEAFISWSVETHNTIVPLECEEVKEKLAMFPRKTVETIWNFPFEYSEKFHLASQNYKETKTVQKIDLNIKLDQDPLDQANLQDAIKKLSVIIEMKK